MTYYVGLDVALRSVSACVIDDQGEIVKEAKLDSEGQAIGPGFCRFVMTSRF